MQRIPVDSHIIIGGLPRSGTSLVRAMIGSHPKIAIHKWELPFWTQIYAKYLDKSLSKKSLENLLNELFLSYPMVKSDVKITIEDVKNELVKNDYPQNSLSIYKIILEKYLIGRGKQIVGIKTPFNEFWIKNIIDHFPSIKFIHVVRNPIDVAISLKKANENWWGGSISYFQHIYYWHKSYQIAQEYSSKFPKNHFIVQYEKVVSDGEVSLREICRFLQIDYHPDMLNMEGQPGWAGENSSFKKGARAKQYPKKIEYLYHQLLYHELKNLGYRVNFETTRGSYLLKFRFIVFCQYFKYLDFIKLLFRRLISK